MINFKHKRIVLMGLGLNQGGLGVAQWLVKHNYPFLITDLRSKKELAPSLKKLPKSDLIKLRLGEHRDEDFKEAEIVIQNPGVPNNSHYIKLAHKNGALVINEAVMFFDRCPAKIVGITGTRGKSSTSWFTYQILKKNFKKVHLTGNIAKQSMMQIVDSISRKDVVVVELSSWHLEKFFDTDFAPKVACLTNLYKDHLNRYKNYTDYKNAKFGITVNQSSSDYFITNKNNSDCLRLAKKSKATVKYFKALKPEYKELFSLKGNHNSENLAASIEIAKTLKLSDRKIKKSLPTIKSLDSRQESLGHIKQVEIINDTTSTAPEATIACINTFKDQPLTIIAGGMNKDLKYIELARTIKKNKVKVVLLPGNASDHLNKALAKYPEVYKVKTLNSAVTKALQITPKGRVALSPAAASFNMFLNEFDRGEHFKKIVKDVQNKKK